MEQTTSRSRAFIALVAATSVGIVGGTELLDLCYEEDSQAEVDMNVVMTADGGLIETQATAEKGSFSRRQLNSLVDLAEAGGSRKCLLRRGRCWGCRCTVHPLVRGLSRRKRRSITRSMALRLIMVLIFASVVSTARAAIAPQCGVNTQVPAKRVFARVDTREPWREYRSIDKVPDLDLDGGISAQLWYGTSGSILIRTVEPGEDFWTYTDYCFAKWGRLNRLGFELRTAWGRAYRIEAPVEGGAIRDASRQFFDIETQEAIPRPEQADDVSDALKPTLYLQTRRLPFSKLLATPPKPSAPSHRGSANPAKTGISP